jgi:hypothetical protein
VDRAGGGRGGADPGGDSPARRFGSNPVSQRFQIAISGYYYDCFIGAKMNAFLEFLFSKAKSIVGKNTYHSSHQTYAFFLAIILFALIGVCIPDASAHADPLVPSDFILAFHIVENRNGYSPTVNLNYMRLNKVSGTIYPIHSFPCSRDCDYRFDSIHLESNYYLLVELEGGGNFTLWNFNIHYSPTYHDSDIFFVNPTKYHVTIDVGQQSCAYIPNDSDKNFQIDGCSRKQSDDNDRATETADSMTIPSAIAQYTETVEAFYRTDTVIYLATASAVARNTETALVLTTASAEAQGTETAAELTNEKALTTTPTPSITSTIQPMLATAANQALSLAALPGVQPTGTIAPPEERSTIGAPWGNILPFLSSEYFVAIVMAVLVESAVVFLLMRIIIKMAEVSSWRIFLACLLINFATIPSAWRIMGLLLRVFSIEYYFIDVVITETLVVIIEALWYRIVLPIRFRQALLLSFCANSASYFGG